jgi:type I restriction enzyme R subunit
MVDISERTFEATIEAALLRYGPDAPDAPRRTLAERTPPFGDNPPGGYHRRTPAQYDRTRCLLPADVCDFLIGTQPDAWERLVQHHGAQVKDRVTAALSRAIASRGSLDVLRRGFKDAGVQLDMAYFRPATALNAETLRRCEGNFFSIVRQLHYSTANEKSLDLVLFLNGVPLFTAELKNPLTGQTVEEAMRQYRSDRDPREPLFAYRRCLAHFAVDPNLVYVTTHLNGARTRFLPFNRGRFGGAGNPPVPPTQEGYATEYLWESIWARESLLDLIRQFIQEVQVENEDGRKTDERYRIFPRYHQVECVRTLVADARANGAGRRYLIQHSAGSGKSFTIAWLAHRLSTLHDAADRRVFDSVIVVTDRRILDRQLQATVRDFEQTLGVVETIDKSSKQLREALEEGKTIIVTTLQKFPAMLEQIRRLEEEARRNAAAAPDPLHVYGARFALIVDEAHSSQSGESSKQMKSVLAADTLTAAEAQDAEGATAADAVDALVAADAAARGRLNNLSLFAFTATPKPKTLELFGVARPDGKFAPFHLYSMRQAIEEHFILDVLENYTTYTAYWRLLKTITGDPAYDRQKATALLKSFVELHPHAIERKVAILVEHFAAQVQHAIGGKAKAMIVTRSRLHAVRYKLAVDRYLKEHGYPFKTLVAFSGTVKDGGKEYTEASMNGIAEAQTARTFQQTAMRFLIVANKFQTGFDQPLLHTMYVDKVLGGVNAVQTLSRLNRTHAQKESTAVLDFANDAGDIQQAFAPYYETTLLSEGTDPALLYDLEHRLHEAGVYTASEVDAFAQCYFTPKTTQAQLYAVLAPIVARVAALHPDDQRAFRSLLTDYVRLYTFLAQVLPFIDTGLEKLYLFVRHLRRLVRVEREGLPVEIQQSIDMESYRVQQTGKGGIQLPRGAGTLDPQGLTDPFAPTAEQLEPLSQIIAELNARFGLNLGEEHRLTIGHMLNRLRGDAALEVGSKANQRDAFRLTFDRKVEDGFQEIVDSNFDLYKRVTDDAAFGEMVKNWLFDQYMRAHRAAAGQNR